MRKTIFHFLLFLFFSTKMHAQSVVNVAMDSLCGPMKNLHGIQYGFTGTQVPASTMEMLRDINLNAWRSKGGINQRTSDSIGARKMIVVSDVYANTMGNYSMAQPWLAWGIYENILNNMMNTISNNNIQYDYYDIWQEPDVPFYWFSGYDHLLEAFYRGITVIKTQDPNAKVVIPSVHNFDLSGFMRFLDDLDSMGAHADAISWHDFGPTYDMRINAEMLRDSLDTRPYGDTMEIHVNSYASSVGFAIPGQKIGWWMEFENSPVDWVNSNCFNITSSDATWNSCDTGFNGLFYIDNISPLPAYWLHHFYGNMQGQKLFIQHTAYTSAIASIDPVNEESKIMLGRMKSSNISNPYPPENLELNLFNYPFSHGGPVRMVVQYIPNVAHFQPMNLPPLVVLDTMININTGDSLQHQFPNTGDGDAYLITIHPSTNVGIREQQTQDVVVYPNPAQDNIFWNTPGIVEASLISFTGQIIAQQKGNNISSLQIPASCSNGLYILHLRTNTGIYTRKKIVVKR
jgi:hypothetical protein